MKAMHFKKSWQLESKAKRMTFRNDNSESLNPSEGYPNFLIHFEFKLFPS